MAMIGKVLRMHHRDKKSVREIAKATSLSRNTVRKYLRRGTSEQPVYRRPAISTKLAPYVEQVKQALAADAHRPKKERRTVLALHKELAAAGYAGGYTRLTDYVRQWKLQQGVPEALQRLRRGLLREDGGDRVMARVLALVPEAGLEAVLVAVQLALEAAPPSGRVSVEHVINVLARLNAQPAPQPVATQLAVLTPPVADTARYDRLRQLQEAEQ